MYLFVPFVFLFLMISIDWHLEHGSFRSCDFIVHEYCEIISPWMPSFVFLILFFVHLYNYIFQVYFYKN